MKIQLFKNARVFRVTPGFRFDPDLLARRPGRDCAPFESKADGFIAPCEYSTRGLIHDVGGMYLMCWQTQDKLLPGHVVEDEVKVRAEDFEQANGYKPGRKMLREIKERVVDELLPKAFTQTRRTFAIHADDWLIIDTSSPARAESMIEAMRSALEELPLALVWTETSPGAAMREWMLGGVPYGLTVDDVAVLEGPDETKATVSYQRIDLDSDEVRQRIADGFTPRKLAVTILDRVSLHFADDFGLGRIQPVGMLRIETEERTAGAEDLHEEFDGSVILLAGEIVRAIGRLVEALGGFKKPDADLVTEAEESEEVPL